MEKKRGYGFTKKQQLKGAKAIGKKGFAAMSVEKRTEIARLGGLAAHKTGAAHRFTHEEAVLAGRKSTGNRFGCRGKKPIDDEFSHLPVSRQRKHQLRKRKELIEEAL